jgi:hypothetical protein
VNIKLITTLKLEKRLFIRDDAKEIELEIFVLLEAVVQR